MSLLQNDMIDCRNTDEIMAVLSERYFNVTNKI